MTGYPCICRPGRPNAVCAVHLDAALAARAKAYLPAALTIGGPWQGPNEPPPIGAGVNPGGLVAVWRDAYDAELRRWSLRHHGDLKAAAEEGARLCNEQPGSTMVIYDGDRGTPILRLATRPA